MHTLMSGVGKVEVKDGEVEHAKVIVADVDEATSNLEEKRIVRKIDLSIMPVLMWLYMYV